MSESSGDNRPLVRKRWRVVFEVEATGRELTDEVAREHARSYSNAEEVLSRDSYWEDVERQRRLLRAMLADPGMIDAWLGHESYALFEGGDAARALEESDTFIRSGGLDGDWEILRNALGRLSDEDRAVLERAKDAELVYESTDVLSECFDARIVGVEVEEGTDGT
ncbi:hypothetical protein GBA63_19060 [Rubrobacter tropicus]|uniref:Uncharacterized protein n=1 Tax=Rubrobacter tropicus TaxID=2653851 RepID=A0A6G8QDF3_9ACTN|nr:hypothetical protein [Rubrobacter tropicus]QIN84509.1 hypothetical protein GBA63_19060 [Rubrobacter tropicus]